MEKKQKNGQRIVLIVLIFVLAALIAGIAAFLLYSNKPEPADDTTTAAGSVSGEQTTDAPAQTEKGDTQWIDAYRAYLTDRIKEAKAEAEGQENDDEDVAMHFSLIFLDDDAVPEMVISEGFYHAASATLVLLYNGELRTVPDIGSYGGFQYKEKQGIVVSGYDGSGVSSRTVYRLKQGELEKVWSGTESYYYEDNAEFFFGDYENETKVSEAEYQKAYDTYVPKGLTATLRDDVVSPPVTEKNVELYFKALADRDSVMTVRAYTEVSFSGTASEKQTDYYDNSEYFDLILDKPVILQFEEDEFPSLISSVRISDDNIVPGSRMTVKGFPSKQRGAVVVY